ncbi:MAG: hypothetical protein PHR19_06385 [Bacteroidales bacterium]|nr:hypothetical protein [Bacteroidales bacterium]
MREDLSLNSLTELFQEKAKVCPNKFAGQMLAGIISDFFCNYDDLDDMYTKYYQKEYDTFQEYLFKGLILDQDEIEFLLSRKKKNERLCFVDLKHAVNYREEHLFMHDEVNFLDKINAILEKIE